MRVTHAEAHTHTRCVLSGKLIESYAVCVYWGTAYL